MPAWGDFYYTVVCQIKQKALKVLKNNTFRAISVWQRVKDSNPHKRSQSPVCYHYTNPLNLKLFQTQELLYYIPRRCQEF